MRFCLPGRSSLATDGDGLRGTEFCGRRGSRGPSEATATGWTRSWLGRMHNWTPGSRRGARRPCQRGSGERRGLPRACLVDRPARVGHVVTADRRVLTDEMWARLQPSLLDRTPQRGGRWWDHRVVFEALIRRSGPVAVTGHARENAGGGRPCGPVVRLVEGRHLGPGAA